MNDIKFSLWTVGRLCILLFAGGLKLQNGTGATRSFTLGNGKYDENGKNYEELYVFTNIYDTPLG